MCSQDGKEFSCWLINPTLYTKSPFTQQNNTVQDKNTFFFCAVITEVSATLLVRIKTHSSSWPTVFLWGKPCTFPACSPCSSRFSSRPPPHLSPFFSTDSYLFPPSTQKKQILRKQSWNGNNILYYVPNTLTTMETDELMRDDLRLSPFFKKHMTRCHKAIQPPLNTKKGCLCFRELSLLTRNHNN